MASELDSVKRSTMEDMRSVYNETVIDHALNPRNAGSIPGADGYAGTAASDGDSLQMWLNVEDNRITQASFWTDGCAATVASASIVTELVKGKPVLEALRVSRKDVLDALGGLPEGNLHCALLAASTLKEAVRDYLALRKEPWKKAYRRQ